MKTKTCSLYVHMVLDVYYYGHSLEFLILFHLSRFGVTGMLSVVKSAFVLERFDGTLLTMAACSLVAKVHDWGSL